MVQVINGASVTSKRPARMGTGLRAMEAKGNMIRLEDGQQYVDWQMGLHGALYGYRPSWWAKAIKNAVDQIQACSIACQDERIVAEMIGQFYPDVEAVRFMLSGSDPCAAAVKLARAATGRDKILCYGYHGVASAYCPGPNDARPNLGMIPQNLGTLQAERDAYVQLGWLEDLGRFADLSEYAAVVVECPPVDGGREEATSWLRSLAYRAEKHGALFILDEVVTGFRYGPSGAAGYYGLRGLPDLYCFGKTLGNGYPVAALSGKEYVMRYLAGTEAGQVHYSGTFFGEPIGMAVAKATLQRLSTDPPWEIIRSRGTELIQRWNEMADAPIFPWLLQGHPSRPVFTIPADEELDFDELRRYLFQHGHILVSHPLYLCTETASADIEGLVRWAGQWKEGLE